MPTRPANNSTASLGFSACVKRGIDHQIKFPAALGPLTKARLSCSESCPITAQPFNFSGRSSRVWPRLKTATIVLAFAAEREQSMGPGFACRL